jgi:hypothetical protein
VLSDGVARGEPVRTRAESAISTAGSVGAAAARPVLRRINGAALAVLDAMLDSRLAGEVVDRVAASAVAERALSGALKGPLVETVARDLVRYRVADRLLSEGLVEETTARVLEGPELERVVEAALESPTVERLIKSTIESRLVDEAVMRLLESEDLWLLVEEIARSPAVTDAIARQSVGFADQVAGGMRSRSRVADAWVETRARRLLRRPRAEPPSSEAP